MSHSPATAAAQDEGSGRAVSPPRWLPSVRPRSGLWLLLGLCVLTGLALALGNPNYRWSEQRSLPYGADFLQEWVAGAMLLGGGAESIYDPVAFSQWQHDPERVGFQWDESQLYPAVYPPPYYCLVAPVAVLPYRVAALVWLAMMLAAYPLAAWLLRRGAWPRDDASLQHGNRGYGFWCLALFFPAVFMSLVMGQKGTLWLLVAVGCWRLLRADRNLVAGCVWALLTVKPTLCFLLPVIMLANRQWRFCVGMIIGTVALWGGTALIVPLSLWSDYFDVVLGSGSYQQHAGYRPGWSASLFSWFAAAGLPRAWSLGLWAASAGGMLVALVGVSRAGSARERLQQPEFVLRLFAATALLSPHFYFYDLAWFIFPLAGLFRSHPSRGVSYFAALWLSVLAAQQFETGWPILPLVLLSIFVVSSAPKLELRAMLRRNSAQQPA